MPEMIEQYLPRVRGTVMLKQERGSTCGHARLVSLAQN